MLFRSKVLRWLKIAVLGLFCFSLFVIPSGAVFSSGGQSTPVYNTPLRFDFSILGTTAELTPTIKYLSGTPLTYDAYESASSSTSLISTVNRRNFSVSSSGASSPVIDCSYRLTFDVTDSLDDFQMIIKGTMGYYNFTKYGIPELSVPDGYSVNVNVSYKGYFTVDQPGLEAYDDFTVSRTDSYSGNIRDIDLLYTDFSVHGIDHDIVGDVIIYDYSAVLTFTSLSSGPSWGDAGFYLWDTVLTVTPDLDEFMGITSVLTCDLYASCYIYGYDDGVLTTLEVLAFTIMENDGWPDTDLLYELEPDQYVVAYDFGRQEWYSATESDDGIIIDQITPEQMRVIQFTAPVGDAIDTMVAHKQIFYDFFESNTSYYESNPLAATVSDARASTSDGGMYFHYYLDRAATSQFNNAIETLNERWYDMGYGTGANSGGGSSIPDFTTWLSTAVSGIVDAEIFPNFTISGMLTIIIAIPFTLLFLKYFAGG